MIEGVVRPMTGGVLRILNCKRACAYTYAPQIALDKSVVFSTASVILCPINRTYGRGNLSVCPHPDSWAVYDVMKEYNGS